MTKHSKYNDLHNEGGEGYNPYPKRTESKEPRWSILEGKISRAIRIQNGTSTQDARYEELKKEIETLEAELSVELKKQCGG